MAAGTANDPQDSDTGPNNPVLDSAITSGSSTGIAGRSNSTPEQIFTIRYFSKPSGNEGKQFIGLKSVTNNANGNAGTFAFNPAQVVAVGDTVTATATQANSTSEFSAPRTVASSWKRGHIERRWGSRAGTLSSRPSLCPYSPECVEGAS